nr:MAG TPA: hypothetical protein [Caudoviricetes sp.]
MLFDAIWIASLMKYRTTLVSCQGHLISRLGASAHLDKSNGQKETPMESMT